MRNPARSEPLNLRCCRWIGLAGSGLKGKKGPIVAIALTASARGSVDCPAIEHDPMERAGFRTNGLAGASLARLRSGRGWAQRRPMVGQRPGVGLAASGRR